MGLFSKIKLNDILKIAAVLVPLAPVVVHAAKGVIHSKGKTLPDTIVTGVEIANALGGHNDRLDQVEAIIQAAQQAGILPHASQPTG